MKISAQKPLSPLQHTLMQVVWSKTECNADDVRQALADEKPMKESTVRTVLRQLEDKGYVTHRVEGRTYIYSPRFPPQKVAANAVRQIIDRFCAGSVERLLVGMVDDEVLTKAQLKELAKKIDAD